ncbi:Hypothetical predicted protein [Xyrichtys novacula]|uniref:Uncharacterized protein n=1 Tax=Xyrichtys novacula TaxID=13765 RepID=A0AAV1FWH5_XYRNO|nr:Hypothetical predicted protein [Xyrichtys novacula]
MEDDLNLLPSNGTVGAKGGTDTARAAHPEADVDPLISSQTSLTEPDLPLSLPPDEHHQKADHPPGPPNVHPAPDTEGKVDFPTESLPPDTSLDLGAKSKPPLTAMVTPHHMHLLHGLLAPAVPGAREPVTPSQPLTSLQAIRLDRHSCPFKDDDPVSSILATSSLTLYVSSPIPYASYPSYHFAASSASYAPNSAANSSASSNHHAPNSATYFPASLISSASISPTLQATDNSASHVPFSAVLHASSITPCSSFSSTSHVFNPAKLSPSSGPLLALSLSGSTNPCSGTSFTLQPFHIGHVVQSPSVGPSRLSQSPCFTPDRALILS